MSMFISGISAFTFTGNASAAYDAGPTLLVIYFANVVGFAISGLFLGRWFRQTRALTQHQDAGSRLAAHVLKEWCASDRPNLLSGVEAELPRFTGLVHVLISFYTRSDAVLARCRASTVFSIRELE